MKKKMKSKFNKKLEEGLDRYELKKIRVKTDPKDPNKDYTGYFLSENENGEYVVYISGEDSLQEINPNDIEVTTCPKLQKLKQYTLLYMISNGLTSKNDPDLEKLIQVSCVNGLEQFIREKYMGEKDILEIYRMYIEGE